MRFVDALDALEQQLEGIDASLDAGEDPQLPVFEPVELEGPVVAADVDRYEALMVRLCAARSRLQLERIAVVEQLSGLGRQRTAAAAYAAHAG